VNPRSGSSVFAFFVTASRHLLRVADGLILWCDSFFPGRAMQIPLIGEGFVLASGTRSLAAWQVSADQPRGALLLCHGIGDQKEYWRSAQQYLQAQRITSVIFHYSGYAGSEGTTTPGNLEADVRAAYTWLRDRTPPDLPVFVLGFSMGTGVLAEVAPTLQPPPAGVILCQAYTGFRQAAARVVWPLTPLARLMPDIWRTSSNVRLLRLPLLIVHGVSDPLFPVSMAEELHHSAVAAGVDARLALIPGCSHNSVYRNVPPAYWAAILTFLHEQGA
jgi:alpha-beta hydrolase superfamily lysophospholipase